VARTLRQYDDLARCRLEESGDRTELIIQRYVLNRPLGSANELEERRRIHARLQRSALPSNLEPALRRLILGHLPGGVPSLERLADLVGLRPRTLQRRLSERQTSLSTLVDDARREIALRILNSSEGSVGRAARNCGYADTSNFTRAFYRWVGCSPRAYRQQRAMLCTLPSH
jgi:AraC-like DNA-binding protein